MNYIMRTVADVARIAMPLMVFAGMGIYVTILSQNEGYEFDGRAVAGWLVTVVVVLMLLKLTLGSFRSVVRHQVPVKVLVFGVFTLLLAIAAGTLVWCLITIPQFVEARLFAAPFGVAVVAAWLFVRHTQSGVTHVGSGVDDDEPSYAHS